MRFVMEVIAFVSPDLEKNSVAPPSLVDALIMCLVFLMVNQWLLPTDLGRDSSQLSFFP